ncbi:MAG: aminopeptidase P family protein [Clostridia bacterium]|nr:aminopeptidase P family protein [Clostridia bacterium]
MTKIQKLISKGYENAVIFTPQNRFYFTGFEAEDGILLISDGKPYLAMDSRYIEAAQREVTDAEVLPFNKEFFTLLKKDAVTETSITIDDYETLKTLFKDAKLTFSKEFSSVIRELREIKDEKEIECISTAAQIADDAFLKVLPLIKEGVTESEIALELEIFMRKSGASKTSFDTIVLCGKNGSMPHGVPGDTPFKKGDLITMDFGCVYNGYCSDMTRTVALGNVDSIAKEVYETVLKAHKAAVPFYKEGVSCADADKAARDIITAAGYGEYFGHSLGHGVGIDIHEYPNASPKSQSVFKKGNIVTDEPGIYIPEKLGVRIEDMLLVTEKGGKTLSTTQKELIIL